MKILSNLATAQSNSLGWVDKVVDPNSTAHLIGVFSHHRDVKVALEELEDAGFPSSLITLIARNCQRYSWLPNIKLDNSFDEIKLGCDRATQNFFQRLFRRGKYLLLVSGNSTDLSSAGSIIGRRRHSQVWHCK